MSSQAHTAVPLEPTYLPDGKYFDAQENCVSEHIVFSKTSK